MKPSAAPATPAEPITVRPATIERFDDIGPVINRSWLVPVVAAGGW
jgi:hypothetical protein